MFGESVGAGCKAAIRINALWQRLAPVLLAKETEDVARQPVSDMDFDAVGRTRRYARRDG
jgi:hypothetical protein